MHDVTLILAAVAEGDAAAGEQLLPLVYQELRQLAAAKMRYENPGQTLDATALVHEAYLRLVGPDGGPGWDNRGHFFSAAAESMRRILVENARRKSRLRHGGGRARLELRDHEPSLVSDPHQVVEVSDALDRLAQEDSLAATLVKLRYFAGFSVEEAGKAVGLSRANAYRHWKFARAWLQCELEDPEAPENPKNLEKR